MNSLKTLLLVLASLIVGPAGAADTVRVGGVGSLTPLMRLLIADYKKKNPAVDIQLLHPPLGSSGGARALVAGKLDLVLMGRERKPEEAGVTTPWLKTPLILASSGGKTRGLTRSEVADIYAGRRTSWDDTQPIRLVLRGLHESETALLRTLSPGVDVAVGEALTRNAGPIAENDIEALAMLTSIAGSLGSTTLGLIQSSGIDARKPEIVAIDGIKPDLRKLDKQSYPWFRTYLLMTTVQPVATVQAFVAYLQSPAAMALARENAYLPAKQ